MHDIANESVEWLEKHFPGILDTVYFTSAFQAAPEDNENPVTEIIEPPLHKHTNSHPGDPRGQHIPAYSVPRK